MPTSNRPAPCPCGRHGWTLPERIRAAHRCKQGETEGASEPNSEPSCEGEVTWAAHRHPVPSLLADRVPLRLARLLWRPGQTGHNVTRGVATARNAAPSNGRPRPPKRQERLGGQELQSPSSNVSSFLSLMLAVTAAAVPHKCNIVRVLRVPGACYRFYAWAAVLL